MTYKHRDIVLAYLDGKQIQTRGNDTSPWHDLALFNPRLGFQYYFLNDEEFRIKPNKKKGYIAVNPNEGSALLDNKSCSNIFNSKKTLQEMCPSWQIIEIEYEE